LINVQLDTECNFNDALANNETKSKTIKAMIHQKHKDTTGITQNKQYGIITDLCSK